jgi:SAM-dependent methyltransferase
MNPILQWVVPGTFDLFQLAIGGTVAKRNLVLQCHSNQQHILEVGCSVGNIAAAFPGRCVDYVGLDIDEHAIHYAREKFRRQPGFSFICGELCRQKFPHDFDFIVFSGVLHHLDDAAAATLLEFSQGILSANGTLVVSDPVQPRPTDGALIKVYRKLERGKHVRSFEDLSHLLEKLRGLRVVRRENPAVTGLPVFTRPIVSYFGLFLLGHRPVEP